MWWSREEMRAHSGMKENETSGEAVVGVEKLNPKCVQYSVGRYNESFAAGRRSTKDSIDERYSRVLARLYALEFVPETATSDKWLLLEGKCTRGVQELLGIRSGGVKVLQDLGLEVECTADEGVIAFCSTLEQGYIGTAHTDAIPGLLVVLTGAKRVYLAPRPPPGAKGEASPAFYGPPPGFPRHAPKNRPEGNNASVVAMSLVGDHLTTDVAGDPWRRVDLRAGDALFIPSGWVHRVDTDAGTIALSFPIAGERARGSL